MRDPLIDFDWESLYERYDASNTRFNPDTKCLICFGSDRPQTDRELYYRLVDIYSPGTRCTVEDTIGTYKALLYWKLFSTSGRDGTNILAWLMPDSPKTVSAKAELVAFLDGCPVSLERDAGPIIELVRRLPCVPGMGTNHNCPLPVRTTFLHFLFPATVPIFDKKVLSAVGIDQRGANQDVSVLEEYISFAWELADRYAERSKCLEKESPLRRVDMALWFCGSTGSRKKKGSKSTRA